MLTRISGRSDMAKTRAYSREVISSIAEQTVNWFDDCSRSTSTASAYGSINAPRA